MKDKVIDHLNQPVPRFRNKDIYILTLLFLITFSIISGMKYYRAKERMQMEHEEMQMEHEKMQMKQKQHEENREEMQKNRELKREKFEYQKQKDKNKKQSKKGGLK